MTVASVLLKQATDQCNMYTAFCIAQNALKKKQRKNNCFGTYAFCELQRHKTGKETAVLHENDEESVLTYLPLWLCSFIENTATRISYPVVFQILEILPEMWTHVPVIDSM